MSGEVPQRLGHGDRILSSAVQVRAEVFARNGVAATSQPLATQVALDTLKRGGSALDADSELIAPGVPI